MRIFGQLCWDQSVEQAVEDVKLLVNAANDLVRTAAHTERS